MMKMGVGPVPNPRSRRQSGDQAHTWTDLPAGGYDGPIPKWPLSAATGPERKVWQRIWRTPHAAVWARMEWEPTVARYVRVAQRAEERDAPAPIMAEARQLEDRLGLNPQAMLRNRWRVREDDVAEQRTSKPAAKHTQRKRMRVVDDDDVESA